MNRHKSKEKSFGNNEKTRILKYAKPYTSMIIISIILLFVQANCDLALPDYLSRIVNTGIQQGGVENATPIAIREIEMNRSLMFMSDENKSIVLNDYELINSSHPDYNSYKQQFPILSSENIYILKDVNAEEIDRLNLILGKSLIVVMVIEQIMINHTLGIPLTPLLGFYPPALPEGTDFFEILEFNNSTDQLVYINDYITHQYESQGETMLNQVAVVAVKSQYESLGMDMDQYQLNYILHIGLSMILLTLLAMVCIILVSYLSAKIATGMAKDIREDLFKKVENFSFTEFDKFSTASLITRSTNDITQIQMVIVMIIRMVCYAPIMGIGGIIRAINIAPSISWIIALAVIILISLILIIFSIALPKFQILQKLVDRLNLVSRENLSGIMVIRAFNKQKYEESRFDKANKDLTRVSLFVNRLMVIMMPLMMFIMNGLSLIIIWVGANEVANATMQVGSIMGFLQYAMQIVMSFLMLSMMFIFLPRASISGKRISEVLNTKPTIVNPENPKSFNEPFKGIIEFRNVSFRYPGAEVDVLHNISFVAKPGQTTAFIGPTGSGKSTIMNLILRFYDVTSGAILIDGIDIRELSQHDLRQKIGYIPQKNILFTGTIASNLSFAEENADENQIKSALEVSQASEFVYSRPEGIALEISQGGMNVSGGQKQRLSIARAVVKKPQIYILDDSFSALDFKTDASLRRSFKQTSASSTLIIVTQRVSTIKNADQIIVIEEGTIVGKGTHSQLMEQCSTYKEIALSQHTMEELI